MSSGGPAASRVTYNIAYGNNSLGAGAGFVTQNDYGLNTTITGKVGASICASVDPSAP